MSELINIITSADAEVRNRPLDGFCKPASLQELLDECSALEQFRKESPSLYDRVRALFFLYAIHRFHIPYRKSVSREGLIPYEAYEHMLKRRFEEAIDIFNEIQASHGANEGISSGLAEAYHKLAFQTLANQVRKSVRSTLGNQWMFRVGHPDDHPLAVRDELLKRKSKDDLFPLIHEFTPVRMDITHSGWSDIFFLGMDFPDGANVLNVSVDLKVKDDNVEGKPVPPIESFFRVIDRPVLKLTSIDLGATAEITNLSEVFDFAKDYLGLLKAAVIASGLVPPGMEGADQSLAQLLEKLVGPGLGIELVSKVNGIPKGSRLAVSTNLLASLITACMRATRQTKRIDGMLEEDERRLVAARAILGEWIGGSGGGWQDSGGVWPGMKLIRGVKSAEGDPEYGISRGRLLPVHTILEQEDVTAETRKKLQDSLVMVHGGMAQDVGPILEMVTEKYLLRSEKEWEARKQAITYFDDVVAKLKEGNIEKIGNFTQNNFEGPIQAIIPWASNMYTELIINTVRKEFGDDFWGFWMMGGMSGGGMGFIFKPERKVEAQKRLQEIMSDAKKKLERAVPFAMEPVVYDFALNEYGTRAAFEVEEMSIMPKEYYTLHVPELLKKDLQELTRSQRMELDAVGKAYRSNKTFDGFVPELFERMIPSSADSSKGDKSLKDLLAAFGFDAILHQQIKQDLKSGRIGLAQNRLPVSSQIGDIKEGDVYDATDGLDQPYNDTGMQALKNGELAIVSLAGGAGSRWTKGAGVVKSLNPYAKMAGKHRNFVETHLAKSAKISETAATPIPHVFTTSYLTHDAISDYLTLENNYKYSGNLYLSPGKVIGLRMVPMARDLRFEWEEMPQQLLDEQAQKMQESLHTALIGWAKSTGEGEDYTDNLPQQCVHPVGHWYEVPNLFLNGTLKKMLDEQPNLKYLMVHNIDTLGANADPALLGYHIQSGNNVTTEVITRKLEDRGGGLARIDGRLRLIEGLALPNEEIEFELTYYNSSTTWVTIDDLLGSFELTRNDLDDQGKVKECVRRMARRMPTYITLKDVKKRWGKGQEDIFPVTQFEKLWGDMTALPELKSGFVAVPRLRGQQLKEPAQLDGWLRDGSAAYLDGLCKWS